MRYMVFGRWVGSCGVRGRYELSDIASRDYGREEAAREMLTELGTSAPQFLEAARRFGKAGLMPADVVERIVPARS